MNQSILEIKSLFEEEKQEKEFLHLLDEDLESKQKRGYTFKEICEFAEKRKREEGLIRWLIQPTGLQETDPNLYEELCELARS